jgi:hypothetical protein
MCYVLEGCPQSTVDTLQQDSYNSCEHCYVNTTQDINSLIHIYNKFISCHAISIQAHSTLQIAYFCSQFRATAKTTREEANRGAHPLGAKDSVVWPLTTSNITLLCSNVKNTLLTSDASIMVLAMLWGNFELLKLKLNPVAWVRKRTIPAEKPQFLCEACANFWG